jgi:hypothetical protein
LALKGNSLFLEAMTFICDFEWLAEKAKNMGVKVDVKLWKKMWYIFYMLHLFVLESRQALNEI